MARAEAAISTVQEQRVRIQKLKSLLKKQNIKDIGGGEDSIMEVQRKLIIKQSKRIQELEKTAQIDSQRIQELEEIMQP